MKRFVTNGVLAFSLFLGLLAACGAPEAQPDPELPMTRPEEVSESVNQALSAATRLELLTLNPLHRGMQTEPDADGEYFHDYAILARTAVDDRERVREILNLVYEGIHESDGTVAACFNPRHGIRALAGEQSVDLVICFECLSMSVHLGDEQDSITTSRNHQAEMNGVWVAEGLPLAGKQ